MFLSSVPPQLRKAVVGFFLGILLLIPMRDTERNYKEKGRRLLREKQETTIERSTWKSDMFATNVYCQRSMPLFIEGFSLSLLNSLAAERPYNRIYSIVLPPWRPSLLFRSPTPSEPTAPRCTLLGIYRHPCLLLSFCAFTEPTARPCLGIFRPGCSAHKAARGFPGTSIPISIRQACLSLIRREHATSPKTMQNYLYG